MKVAVVQMNPIVGDIEGNAQKIIRMYEEADRLGVELVVFPECALTGYPLEDLVLRESFTKAASHRAAELAHEINGSAAIIFGTPVLTESGPINAAIFFDPQEENFQVIQKVELPNYGVFDEKRVFVGDWGGKVRPVEFRGRSIGVMICEDCWFDRVSGQLREQGAELLIAINGSPFEIGKDAVRENVVRQRVAETGVPFLYVNLVGGQDELVFDGGSFLYDGELKEFPAFVEGVFVTDIKIGEVAPYEGEFEPSGLAEVYQALVLGTRDYLSKQGFKSVVLGYSGGVDSGLVAAIACDAVGHENVLLVRLPSKFSSGHSLSDAEQGAKRLGAAMRTINIEPIVASLRYAYEQSFVQNTPEGWGPNDEWPRLTGTADENIQARARGNILMAISNQEGHLLLTTGNKSEVSVGYSTLYGDMSGGFNPVKDCYKTTVWDLCRWRNQLTFGQIREYGFKGAATEVVPEAIIVKPPSAELRPDQKDEDSLPPYPVLDAILKGMIEREKSIADLVGEGIASEDTITRVRNLVDNAEYKRRQAAPGVKITSKIFGRDRRYPIVNRWRG